MPRKPSDSNTEKNNVNRVQEQPETVQQDAVNEGVRTSEVTAAASDTGSEIEKDDNTLVSEDTAELTSVDLLWKGWAESVDAWSTRLECREERLVEAVNRLVTDSKRRQQNAKELLERVGKEVGEWERLTREEYMASTSGVRYFFPFQSFKETNDLIDNVKDRIADAVRTPLQTYANIADKNAEWLVDWTERYVAARRETREKFVSSLKDVAKDAQERQSRLVRTFQKQMKNFLFPISRYTEETEADEPKAKEA